MLKNHLEKAVKDLKQNNLLRDLKIIDGSQGTKVIYQRRKVLNFCSNNYLGLANDSRVSKAALEGLKKQGFGSGAARLICGNMNVHSELEKQLAKFKQSESCLLFSTGYMANIGIISSLFSKDDCIFADRLNHASIWDGIALSGAKLRRYPHCDVDVLEEMLREDNSFKKRAIITDSVFSMDGDYAPLDKIVKLAQKYNCITMIDEAHALGVLGKNGRGLAEYCGVEKYIDIQMGTLSKAAGTFGAYCCGSKLLISYLQNKARSFIYTTGMPPSVAAASIKSLEIMTEDHNARDKLWENTRYMLAQLKILGYDTMNSQTPIIPILVKNSKLALTFSKKLLEKGLLLTAIRPPTVPKDLARLRLTVMATHKKTDLDYCLRNLQTIGKELCLI